MLPVLKHARRPPRSYGYAVWRGFEEGLGHWPQLIAERGGDFPVLFDDNHAPTQYYRYGRLVIVGRLNGRVERHYVDPYIASTWW